MRSSGTFDALGATFEIRGTGRVPTNLSAACADLGVDNQAEADHRLEVKRGLRGRWTVRDGDGVNVARIGARAAIKEALRAIDEWAAATAAVTDTVLRAGALEIDGQAVAFIGRRRLLEPTLVRGATSGHEYVSNGVVAIAVGGHVRPFHRPVTQRPGVTEFLGHSDEVRAGEAIGLGGRVALSEGAPLGLVVILNTTEVAFSADRLTPAHSLTWLAGQAVGAVGYERVMFRRLNQLVRRVPVLVISTEHSDRTIDVAREALRDSQTDW